MLVAHSPSRRATLMALAAAAALVACEALGPPRSMVLAESDLQILVDKHFPIERRLLDVLEVSIAPPRLQLLPERNRVATELQIGARDRLFGGRWQARMALDSMLRWEASDKTLRLAQVRAQPLVLDNGGSLAQAQAERLTIVLAERVLEGLVVYRLSPERAERLQRAGVQPSAVAVTPRGVEITFQPASQTPPR